MRRRIVRLVLMVLFLGWLLRLLKDLVVLKLPIALLLFPESRLRVVKDRRKVLRLSMLPSIISLDREMVLSGCI